MLPARSNPWFIRRKQPLQSVPFGGAIAEEAEHGSARSNLSFARQKQPLQFVPFGGGIAEEAGHGSPTSSRTCLRKSISRARRRGSLTHPEHGFLEDLCEHGSEMEVQTAHRTLLNEDLFFQAVLADIIPEVLSDGSDCSRTDGLGSKRRQEHLQERRKCPLSKKMMKVHEYGLAASCHASEWSLLRKRYKSLTFNQDPLYTAATKYRSPLENSPHSSTPIIRSRRSSLTSSAFFDRLEEEGRDGVEDKEAVQEDKREKSPKGETVQEGTVRRAVRRSSIFQKRLEHPVLMRKASMNVYSGEGFEIADWEAKRPTFLHNKNPSTIIDMATTNNLQSSSSFDETSGYSRLSRLFKLPTIHRSHSDDTLLRHMEADQGFLWSIEDYDHYDSWLVMEDEDVQQYGGSLPFQILGTSASDVDCHPHVLSPPIMESLQFFLPFAKRGENMLLKYSLVRDGASIMTFLQHARAPHYTILAIETVDGEVFGSFTPAPWRTSCKPFGNGGESFLWKMKGSRREKFWSIVDQAHMESGIEIYPFAGGDPSVQLCRQDRIVVGGTSDSLHTKPALRDGTLVQAYEWGFGLCIEDDFLHGTTSPCTSFNSPSLSKVHSNGSVFEIMNLELWTMTPFMSQADAEKLEFNMLFLEQHTR